MNQDKEFLGTQPIGKLLFKLAIPTVIAQLVNMLYNIVDRIYIGHIPGEGSLALTGVGVCMPIICLCMPCLCRRCTACIHRHGKRRSRICRKDPRRLCYTTDHDLTGTYHRHPHLEP